MTKKRHMTARAMLRAFQSLHDGEVDSALLNDLAYVQHKDLDMSVRLGGMLAFNALLITAAINPIAASPGAPLSLDAPTQAIEVVAVCIGIVPLVVSALLCVRAMLIGEEFTIEGIEQDLAAIRQRMLAAYCHSVDQQSAVIRHSVTLTISGGVISLATWIWILIEKMV
ncbi:MAG: hypothetical protein ACKVOJ_04805 [Sphingomonadaceae bacterium]